MLEVIKAKPYYPFNGAEKGRVIPVEYGRQQQQISPLQAQFTAIELANILSEKPCVGIRFFVDPKLAGEESIIAVGLQNNRHELEKTKNVRLTNTSKTKLESIPTDPNAAPKEMSKPSRFASAFFSKQHLEEVFDLADKNLNLLVFLDTLEVGNEKSAQQYFTFTIADEASVAKAADSTIYLQSAAPCPPDCGGGGAYSSAH
ncbi:MAG: hypothetical protein AB8G22_27165 [Saprospiraceae bacterium]